MLSIALVLIAQVSTPSPVEEDLARIAASLGEVPALAEILSPAGSGRVPGAWYSEEAAGRRQALAEEAERLRGSGDFEGALELAQDALKLAVEQLGPEHAAAREARRGVEMLERACALGPSERRELSQADALTPAFVTAYAEERFSDAEQILSEQMDVHARLLGARTPDRATNLRNRAMLHAVLTSYREELADAIAAFDLRMELYGPGHADVPDALHQIGDALNRLDRFDEAALFLRASLARQVPLTGADHQAALPMIGDLAAVDRSLGRYEEAATLYGRAIALYEAQDQRDPNVRYGLARALDNYGVVAMDLGEFDRAEASLSRALELRTRLLSRESAEVAVSLNNLQALDRFRGDFQRAETRARESLAIRRALGAADRIVTGERSLSHLLAEKGDLEGAEQHVRAALRVLAEEMPDARVELAWAKGQLGWVLLSGGHVDEASELLAEAAELMADTVGGDHPDWTLIASNLAYAQRRSGRVEEARELYRRVLTVRREQLGPDHPSVGKTLEALSALTFEAGELEASRGFADEALRIARLVYGESHDAAARARTVLGRLAALRGDLDAAEEHLKAALEVTDALRDDVPGLEAERARFSAQRLRQPTVAQLLAGVLVRRGRLGEALEAAERGRSRELLDLLARADVDLLATLADEDHAQAVTAEAATARAKAVAADVRLAGAGFGDLDAVRAVQASRAALQDADAALLLLLHEAIPESHPASADEVRAGLVAGELLLSLIDSEDGACWLAVPPAGAGVIRAFPIARSAEEQAALQASARAALEAVRSGDPDAERDLAALASRLFPAELEAAMLASERLILVAEALAGLPFGALPILTSDGPRPLVAAGPELVFAPSASVFLDRRARARSQSAERELSCLVVGDPVFAGAAGDTRGAPDAPLDESQIIRSALERLRLREGRLPSLAGSRAEAIAIAELVESAAGTADLLLDASATTEGVERHLDGARFVHVATHGILGSTVRPLDAALALTAPRTPTVDDLGYLTLERMLRNWRGRLASCELVVLSACQSGVGARLGDTTISLPWGPFYAGAPAVLVSLWKVDDRATTLLMRRFYENLLGVHAEPRSVGGRTFDRDEELPKAAALAEAQTWLRARAPADNLADLDALGFDREDRSRDDGGPPGPTATLKPRPTEAPGDFSAPRYWAAFALIGAPD